MKVDEYQLCLSNEEGDLLFSYMGNESICIKQTFINKETAHINVPRFALAKFLEIIENV